METGTYISLGEAAKLAGVSKATISKALKIGKISYIEKTKAGYKIDPSEVARVYPPKRSGNGETERLETPSETNVLQAEINGKDRLIAEMERTIADLRDRLDNEATERRQLTALLTDQTGRAGQGRTWWPFGRKSA